MNARDIIGFESWLKASPLYEDRIWSRPLESISSLEVQLFYARAGLLGLKKQAYEAIDTLQSELLLAGLDERISNEALRLIQHEVPNERFTVDEFIDKLVSLSPVRRAAVLMALVLHWLPSKVAELGYAEAKGLMQLPSLAEEILASRRKLRHVKLPYVFWEWATPTIAAPLLNLQTQTESAFGELWPAIQVKWDEMIWIDRRSEGASFLSLVDEIEQGKL